MLSKYCIIFKKQDIVVLYGFIMDKKILFFLVIIVVIILSFLAVRYIMETIAISKLQVTVKGVQIQELKVSYAKLKLIIEMSNPTGEDISQLSTEYNIFIASSIVGNGGISLTNIPAQATKEASTTVIIYFANVANAVLEALTKQNFNLTIQGTLHVKVLFDLLSISHDFSSTYYYLSKLIRKL